MSDEYKDAMGRLRFTDEQKARLAGAVAAEARRIEGASVASRLQDEGVAHPADPSVRAVRGGRKRLRWPFAAAAAAAAVALAVGTGGAAYAARALLDVPGALDDLFNGAPASTEVIDSVGRPIGASATSNGVTVTAETVVGDRTNIAVVFSIERDDGKPFDEALSSLMFESGSSIHVDGMRAANGGSYFYDADPDDDSVQYVVKLSFDTDDGTVIGKTARVSLSNLMVLGDEGATMVTEGSWNLKFTIDYEDTTRDLEAGYDVDLNGMGAHIDSVELSPIGIVVEYTVEGTMDASAQESGKESEEHASMVDRFLNLPISVTLADGTAINGTSSGGSSAEDGDVTHVRKTVFFDTLADPADVVGVNVGGKDLLAG